MQTTKLKALGRAATATAALAMGAASFLSLGSSAGADPKQLSANALVGVGSDTTQDVMNALAGEANGKFYNPLRSSAASGNEQLVSFDATGSNCVTPRAPGGSFDRPNGSSRGREAVTAAYQAGNPGFERADVGCTNAPTPTAGLVNFARSSSGVTTTTGDLTYVPFGRDALAFAYYSPAGVTPATSIPLADLQSLHTNSASSAAITVGGTRVIACRIQQGSGTYEQWNSRMGNPNQTTLDTSTGECPVPAGINGLQENDAAALKSACDAVNAARATPDTQCVIGFSAANYISQLNQVAKSQIPALAAGQALDLGTIPTVGGGNKAYTGAAPSAAPNATYYASSFGRDVYNVLPTSVVNGFGNNQVKTMFITDDGRGDAGPAMCSSEADAIIQLFGFSPLSTCGDTTLKGPWRTQS